VITLARNTKTSIFGEFRMFFCRPSCHLMRLISGK
jgi:hypothetical protein